MPTVNLYYKNRKDYLKINKSLTKIRKFMAKELTCKEINLNYEEISVRFIKIEGNGTIGEVELDITAYQFAERLDRMDSICKNIAIYLENECDIKNVRVWLKLCNLGHTVY